jgi:hypothetical protein
MLGLDISFGRFNDYEQKTRSQRTRNAESVCVLLRVFSVTSVCTFNIWYALNTLNIMKPWQGFISVSDVARDTQKNHGTSKFR